MEPKMKTLSLSEAKAKLSGLVDEVSRRDEEVVITKNGRPAAVLVSADEYESWQETLAVRADAGLMRDIKKGLVALKARKAKLYTLQELFK
jgi:prevent-host-death family protein